MYHYELIKAIREAVYYRLGYCDLSKETLDILAYYDLADFSHKTIRFLYDTVEEFLWLNGKPFYQADEWNTMNLYYSGYDYAGCRYILDYSGAAGRYWNNGREYYICL